MPVFFLHDTRVESRVQPRGSEREVVQVGPADSLSDKISNLVGLVQRNPYAGRQGLGTELVILCHGSPQGLLLGRAPAVTQVDVGVFGPLRHLVGTISMRACSAAMNYNRGNPPAGPYDGLAFCSGLARTASAVVMASDTTQGYGSSSAMWNSSEDVVLSAWLGNVGTWDRNGHLLGVTTPGQRAMGGG
jgi:hypothetical protein